MKTISLTKGKVALVDPIDSPAPPHIFEYVLDKLKSYQIPVELPRSA